MALLTLIENAVRHGIDPSEDGGRIEVGARRDPADGRVRVSVLDTGVGMQDSGEPGTGLANLRERLQAFFGADAGARTARGLAAWRAGRDRVRAGRRGATTAPGARRSAAVTAPTALIADDEPLLRERLRSHLARLWPELAIVAEARNGREAVELFDLHAPQVVFLDVQMPGLNGVEAARSIGRRAEIVFVTAYEQYAVQAFTQGALDYLVKPFEAERLADTVQRLKSRLQQPRDPAENPLDAVLDELASELKRRAGSTAARAAICAGSRRRSVRRPG